MDCGSYGRERGFLWSRRSQIRIFFVRQGHRCSLGHLLVILVEQLLVDLNLGRGKGWSGNKFQLRVANEFSGQPKERLLEVVVGLGRNVVVLQVLLAMECDGL